MICSWSAVVPTQKLLVCAYDVIISGENTQPVKKKKKKKKKKIKTKKKKKKKD